MQIGTQCCFQAFSGNNDVRQKLRQFLAGDAAAHCPGRFIQAVLDFIQAQNDYRTVRLSYLNLLGSYLNAAGQMNLAVGREAITP